MCEKMPRPKRTSTSRVNKLREAKRIAREAAEDAYEEVMAEMDVEEMERRYYEKPPPHASTYSAPVNFSRSGNINRDEKWIDQSANSAIVPTNDWAACDYSPASGALNAVGQGSSSNTRDGDAIWVAGVIVHGVIQWPRTEVTIAAGAAGQTSPMKQCMVALVCNMQCNGAAPTTNQVYQNALAIPATRCSPLRDLNRTKQYRVIASRKLTKPDVETVNDGTSLRTPEIEQKFELYFNTKVPDQWIQTLYNGNGGLVGNIITNAFHVIANATTEAPAQGYDPHPFIVYNSRVKFFEKKPKT